MGKLMAMMGPNVKSLVLHLQSLSADSKRYLLVGAALLAFLLATALMSAGDNDEVVAPYLHRVEAFHVKGSDHYEAVRLFSGRVNARQHADMGFEQGGKLAEVLVDEGEWVEQGDVLAILDSELLHIEEREQLAQLRDAKAKLKLTENSLTRQTSLKRSGFTSEQRIDELNTEKESLLATIARLDAAVASVASRVRKASLVAPFDGVVTRRFADQGGAVNPAQSVLRLQQSGSMEAHIGVPLKQSAALELGSTHRVNVAGQSYIATVLAVGADLHPLTRTVMVRLGLDVKLPLVNGELATMTLVSSVETPGYWLPASAMNGGVRGLWNVLKLKAEGEDQYRIEVRSVEVLYTLDDQVFVSGDLSEGESIVATGGQRVVAGQLVRQKVQPELLDSMPASEPDQGAAL